MKVKLNNAEIELTEQQRQDLLNQLNQSNVKELVEKELLEMLEKYKHNVIFLTNEGYKSKYPTYRFEILDDAGNSLFDFDFSECNNHFWYSKVYIYEVFKNKYKINHTTLIEVIKNIREKYF